VFCPEEVLLPLGLVALPLFPLVFELDGLALLLSFLFRFAPFSLVPVLLFGVVFMFAPELLVPAP
jgi:hypothetical protein